MSRLAFTVKGFLRRRRWRRYWRDQENRNHVEYFRRLSAEWRARDTT